MRSVVVLDGDVGAEQRIEFADADGESSESTRASERFVTSQLRQKADAHVHGAGTIHASRGGRTRTQPFRRRESGGVN